MLRCISMKAFIKSAEMCARPIYFALMSAYARSADQTLV